MPRSVNPIADLLVERSSLVIDGALATELEARGLDLSSALWSAKALQETPDIIYQVHLDYFRAGADIAITASYQATPLGLHKHLGMHLEDSQKLIGQSVELAQRARDNAVKEDHQAGRNQRQLLVAGSVGPYGAYLADGSEYRGDYSIPVEEMMDFHRPRIQALVDAGVDLLACETIPSFSELKALVQLLQSDFPTTSAWITCTVRDHAHLSDGTPLEDVAATVNASKQTVAFGINCIPEQDVCAVLDHLRPLTNKPLVVYPNSGEQWDAKARAWSGQRAQGQEHARLIRQWREKGARLIGGCCRTGPQDIEVIRNTL